MDFSIIYQLIKRLIAVKVDDARVAAAEKATSLLASIVYFFVLFMLALCLLGFISAAGAHWLSQVMSPGWAYLIIAGFYALLVAIFVLGKRVIVIDPIARFISKLFVKSPNEVRHEEE